MYIVCIANYCQIPVIMTMSTGGYILIIVCSVRAFSTSVCGPLSRQLAISTDEGWSYMPVYHTARSEKLTAASLPLIIMCVKHGVSAVLTCRVCAVSVNLKTCVKIPNPCWLKTKAIKLFSIYCQEKQRPAYIQCVDSGNWNEFQIHQTSMRQRHALLVPFRLSHNWSNFALKYTNLIK